MPRFGFGLRPASLLFYPSAMASQEIEALTQALARLPGLGPRSARRAVLHLLKKREAALTPLLRALERVAEALAICSVCGNVDTIDPCTVCADPRRDDAAALRGRGGIGPLGARPVAAVPRALSCARRPVVGARGGSAGGFGIDRLISRVAAGGVDEVVLAMNATLEGQTTAHYLAERLEDFPVRVTQLAHGLPVGGELDYLDEGTLAQALRARRPVS